jgi:hypothetical protein
MRAATSFVCCLVVAACSSASKPSTLPPRPDRAPAVEGNDNEVTHNYVYGTDIPLVRGNKNDFSYNIIAASPQPNLRAALHEIDILRFAIVHSITRKYLEENHVSNALPDALAPLGYLNTELEREGYNFRGRILPEGRVELYNLPPPNIPPK